MEHSHDVIVVGGGPGGAAAATFAARGGARVLMLERTEFPRDKVCGDCLIPECWALFDRLGVTDAIRRLPHAEIDRVSFVSRSGRTVGFRMAGATRGEFAVARRELDHLLAQNAASAGVEVRFGSAVTGTRRVRGQWEVITETGVHRAGWLVAADGRNSTVARSLGWRARPRPERDRVGIQAHAALPDRLSRAVQLRSLPGGYGGFAAVGGNRLNISLAGRPSQLETLKSWAESEFGPVDEWRAIAPLARRDFPVAPVDGCLLVGDAARLVEPFTGEGVFYALRSGELAAGLILELLAGRLSPVEMRQRYRQEHARLYRGRIWVNRLARAAVLHPRVASALVGWSARHPACLRRLAARVVGPLQA